MPWSSCSTYRDWAGQSGWRSRILLPRFLRLRSNLPRSSTRCEQIPNGESLPSGPRDSQPYAWRSGGQQAGSLTDSASPRLPLQSSRTYFILQEAVSSANNGMIASGFGHIASSSGPQVRCAKPMRTVSLLRVLWTDRARTSNQVARDLAFADVAPTRPDGRDT
jgi:hypothetical protein